MIEFRLRTGLSDEAMRKLKGKIVPDSAIDILLTGDVKVLKPDGSVLCLYRKAALGTDLLERSYETLHSLKALQTNNRGVASGYGAKIMRGKQVQSVAQVSSAIIGSYDQTARRHQQICRLTAWTGKEWDRYTSLWPLFQEIAELMRQAVPDRHRIQMAWVNRTHPDWVIAGTPFTTITVNNTYPTGVHTDKGDLEEGFSNIATLRKGAYRGGILTFPRYRLGVDMGHGDVIHMDAHEWHGNTALETESEDAERISIVAYYRTKMAECGSPTEEAQDLAQHYEKVNQTALDAPT